MNGKGVGKKQSRLIQALFQHLPEEIEKNHKTNGQLVSLLKL
jgi:spore maturation protein SpmA